MATAALIVAILSAIGVLWLGYQQLRLGREQLKLAKRQADLEDQRELARTAPDLEITPGAIASAGQNQHEYHVEIFNASKATARGVTLKAFVRGQPAGSHGPGDVPRGPSFQERVLLIPFPGPAEELRRVVSFVAIDRDGREWTREP